MLELSKLKPPYTKEVWMAMIFNIRNVKKKGKHELELFFDVAKFQKPDLFFQFRFFNLTPEKKQVFSVLRQWLFFGQQPRKYIYFHAFYVKNPATITQKHAFHVHIDKFQKKAASKMKIAGQKEAFLSNMWRWHDL